MVSKYRPQASKEMVSFDYKYYFSSILHNYLLPIYFSANINVIFTKCINMFIHLFIYCIINCSIICVCFPAKM